jgi:hypothetical protein
MSAFITMMAGIFSALAFYGSLSGNDAHAKNE